MRDNLGFLSEIQENILLRNRAIGFGSVEMVHNTVDQLLIHRQATQSVIPDTNV